MARALLVDSTTSNSPSPEINPVIEQPLNPPTEIGSDVVPESDKQIWKIQIIEDLRLAKGQLQEDLQRKLEEIRQEAVKAHVLDDEIDPIQDEAYDEASLLLEMLLDYNIPIPHIGWAEDGSIGLEWRPENGIITVGIYGDNLAIYGVFFEENRQLDGVCSLSDPALLEGFLETLKRLL